MYDESVMSIISPFDAIRKGFVSPTEVAEVLGLSPGMVRKLCNAGEVPCRKFGSSIRIPRTWLDDQLREAGP